MSNNNIDKVIAKYAPGWALGRAVSRHNLSVLNSAYNPPGYGNPNGVGSGGRRRADTTISRQTEDAVAGPGYDQLIANCMQLYRLDPMTKSIVDVVATYMGESRPMATTGDASFDDMATAYFNEFFWNIADARRRPGVDFGMMQNLWTKYSFVGGDMLYAIMDEGLYPYEGMQVRTPNQFRADDNIKHGIRVEPKAPNRISHYYVTALNSGSLYFNAKEDFQRIPQSQAIFAPGKYWRTAMLRSMPELHAVATALMDYGETAKNVQGKIKFESMLFTVERKGGLVSGPGSNMANRGGTGGQVEHSDTDYGMRFQTSGTPDQDFKLSNMNNPGAQHVPYMEHAGRLIASGVGLPYEIVAHLYTNGSYTANRAARSDFKKNLMDRWAWRNKVLNQRVYNWAIAKAIKAKEIPPAPIDKNGRSLWHKCVWTLPHFPQIDEGKEIAADIKKWGAGQDSIADWGRETGRTRDQMLDAHDRDVRDMKARAEALGVTLAEYMGELFKASASNDGGPALPDNDSEMAGVEKWLT
jgi:hypothetical protein